MALKNGFGDMNTMDNPARGKTEQNKERVMYRVLHQVSKKTDIIHEPRRKQKYCFTMINNN